MEPILSVHVFAHLLLEILTHVPDGGEILPGARGGLAGDQRLELAKADDPGQGVSVDALLAQGADLVQLHLLGGRLHDIGEIAALVLRVLLFARLLHILLGPLGIIPLLGPPLRTLRFLRARRAS